MKQKLLLTLTFLVSVLAANLLPLTAAAAGASISLVANRSSLSVGGEVIVAIYVNGGGTPIYGVESDLSYPASKLQYIGFSATGSSFEISAINGGSSGLAQIARGTVSPVSGSGLVGTATFKALSGSGTATISVGGSSALSDANGNPISFSPGGVSVSLTSYSAPVASSSTSPTAATAAPAATPAAPAPPKDTTPPVISAVRVKDLTSYSATITWTTNEPADSNVDYGLDTNYGLSASTPGLTTTHSVALNGSFLTPKTIYHYRIKTSDSSGNLKTGVDAWFELPGVPVTVIVRGANGKPQAGAEVTLDNETGTTNAQGSVTLSSGLGNKEIVTNYGGATATQAITVGKTTKPLTNYQLDLDRQPLNRWMVVSLLFVIVILGLLAFDAAVFGSRLLARLTGFQWLVHVHLPHIHQTAPAGGPSLSHFAPLATDPAPESAPSSPSSPAVSTPVAPVPEETNVVSEPEPVEAQNLHSRLFNKPAEVPAPTAPPATSEAPEVTVATPPLPPVAPTNEPSVTKIAVSEAPQETLPPAKKPATRKRHKTTKKSAKGN